MTFPILIKTNDAMRDYCRAINTALEKSLKHNYPVYIYRITEGGYAIDDQAEVYSNESNIFKCFKGIAQ